MKSKVEIKVSGKKEYPDKTIEEIRGMVQKEHEVKLRNVLKRRGLSDSEIEEKLAKIKLRG